MLRYGHDISRFLLLLAVLAAIPAGASGTETPVSPGSTASGPLPISLPAELEQALVIAHVSPDELTLPLDYELADHWRLEMVDRAMARPLETGTICQQLAGRVTQESIRSSLGASWEALDTRSEMIPPAEDLAPRPFLISTSLEGPRLRWFDELVRSLVNSLANSRSLVMESLSALSPDDRAALVDGGARLIEEDPRDTEKSIFELEEDKWNEVDLAASLFATARKIDRERLCLASLETARAIDTFLATWNESDLSGADRIARQLREIPLRERFDEEPVPLHGEEVLLHDGAARGDILVCRRWGGLRLILGGPGPTTYEESPALIIDLGGDDVYRGGAGGTKGGEMPVSILIDLSGNDLYAGSEPAAVAAGYLGIGMLADLAGNDRYQTGNFGQGCGWYGVGVLLDFQGDDEYVGDTAVQGGGSIGVGLLSDREGNDTYQAAFASQGFGFVGGVGVLDDRSGHDSYLVRAKYTDILRYEDHYLSLSQGFGFGYRPEVSGGIGLLSDAQGNDLYLSDIFGQGASYWYSLGCLVDQGGNDSYVSYQYAQGAGVHLAAAALVDERGNDRYSSRGVSQGCGHDLAVGILWDRTGDDHYLAYDLSQGAGSANGIGVLVDERGSDGYWVMRPGNTHGYGNPRRQYGSVGLILDLAGSDRYAGRGADSLLWRGPWFGVGADLPSNPLSEEGPVTVEAPSSDFDSTQAYTVEDLFIMASSGEPRFAQMRTWARQRLIEMKGAAVPTLVSKLGTTDARDRHTVRELLVEIGEPALFPVIEVLDGDDWRAALLAARVLGEMGDLRGRKPLEDMCGHPRWVIRETAVTALGRIGAEDSFEILDRIMDRDESPYVRKSAAFALGELGSRRAARALVRALEDERAMVRETARTSLVKLDSLAAPILTETLSRAVESERGVSPRTAALVLEALGEICGHDTSCPDFSDLLVRLTRSSLWQDPELRASAATALAGFDSPAASGIRQDLRQDPDWRVRGLAE